MPFGLGVGEMLLILVFLLLVFGAKRLPELGGALGKGIREFRGSLREIEGELTRPPDSGRELKSSAPESQAAGTPTGADAAGSRSEGGETPKQQG